MAYTMETAMFFVLFVCGNLVTANPFADQPRKQYGSITFDGALPIGDISILKDHVINGTAFYSPNADASWKFDLEDDSYVVLKSVYFNLELSQECMFDAMTIVENGQSTKVCGNGPFSYISQSNKVDISFKSDETYEGEGFKIGYDIRKKGNIKENGGCNSFIRGGEDNLLFDTEDVCFYRLEAPPGQLIELDLKMVGFGSRSCGEESIRIYRGVSTHGKLLTEICSDHVHGPINVFEEKLFIEYKRTVVLDDADMKGFRVGYKFVEDTLTTTPTPVTTPSPVGGDNECSGFYKDRSSSFEIDFPHYANNRECIVVVRNNLLDNHVVQVTFENFELEEIEGCIFDSVRVISGEDSESYSLGGPYCGMSLTGKTFLTYGNSLRLEFKTDESFALYGFKAKIDFVARFGCSCRDPNKVCIKQGYEKQCLTGEVCNRSIRCMNGGTCVKTSTSSQCYCRKGYSGEDCSVQESGGELRFEVAPISRTVIRGDNLVATCVVDGPASYTWTLNGETIGPFDNGGKGFGVLPGEKYLQINDFNEDMEGEYTCTATKGDMYATIIFEYELVESCQARIIQKPRDKVANKGGQVIFICEAERETALIWNKDGKELDVENSGRLSILDGSSSLMIKSVEESDEGEYTCEAVDGQKCSTKRSAKLTVTRTVDIDDYCGISIHDQDKLSPRISRGRLSKPADNPWQVTMLKSDGNIFCGASVISQRFIMTAAHCITLQTDEFKRKESVKLVLGTTDCSGGDSKAVRYPARIVIHPEYNKTTQFNNDIALIELNQPLEYSKFIRPICLQRASFYHLSFFEGRRKNTDAFGKVAGCGERRQGIKGGKSMKEVNLPYVSRENCEQAYEGKSMVTENMFCAGFDQSLRGDACAGDSGGALVMSDDVRWYQTGIVSHGWGCDQADYFGIFTNVGNYYDWIREVTEFDKENVERI